jgi:hypothetical protein
LDAVASFIGVSGKIHNISTKDFLSIFWNQNQKEWLIFLKSLENGCQ